MKNINKALSIALSVLLLLSVTSVAVNAAEYTGKCGDSVFWELDTETGLLTIFGEGAMYNYGFHNQTNASPFKAFIKLIKTICIEEGITSVGKNALYDLDQLTSVTIKNNSVVICQYAFTYCDKLTSVTIGCDTQGPGGVEIGDSAFAGCEALSFVTLYDGMRTIGTRAFNECVNLKSLTIPNSVKDIGYMFAPYSTTINYRGTSTEWTELRKNNYQLHYYIANCQDKTIYPSGSCGENIIWEINPTDNCLTFSGFGKMTDYGEWDNYFGDCGPLNYYWSKRVNKIMINEGIETVGNYVFDQYKNLSNVLIPDSVTSIGDGAFRGCSNLKEVLIPDSVTSIGEGAFQGCSSLTEVLIPDSVTSISGFSGCVGLTSITIPDSVTTIGDAAFSGCDNLTTMTIPDSVEIIGDDAFSDCENLSTISIGENVVSIGGFAFSDCVNLTSIIIPDSVITIKDGAFSRCDNLTSITIPDSVTTIGKSVFSDCVNLTSITIPDSVTTIGKFAFENCMGLTNITIPYGVTEVSEWMFYQCGSLTNIVIPDSVTEIGKCAFKNCTNLTAVAIDNSSLSKIGSSAFAGCKNLSDVYYAGNEYMWNKVLIDNLNGGNKSFFNAKIHYDCQKVVTPLTCTEAGYVTYTCSCCDDGYLFGYIEPTGHTYTKTQILPTCTTHGYTKYTCEHCGDSYTDYTSNPTGHTLNEDGVCEVCGDKEVSTSHINTQMLSIESVFAMIMNLLAKLFGIFSVT